MSRTDIEFIQIEANEDANAVRDRLAFHRGRRVLLIWPEEGTALIRKLDLVLVQREAMRRAIRLAVVTHDDNVIKHAKELNISTFETIGASERGRWKRGRTGVFTNRDQKPKAQPEPGELMEVASRVRVKRSAVSRLQSGIVRIGILLLLVGVVGAVAYALIPGATVTLTPVIERVSASVEITVNPGTNATSVDIEGAVVPGTPIIIEVEDSASVTTTGQQDLGNARAVGTIVLSNLTNQIVNVPQGTTVSTSTGSPILFRTTEDIAVPAGGQIEAPIEAMPGYAGDIGNVAENLINRITGPLENNLTVINPAATTGGVSRQEKAVTEFDRDLALAGVRQQIQERAYTAMLQQIRGSQFILLETLRITDERNDWIVFDADVGDIAETLTVTMRAEVSAIVVDEQLARQIVFARMSDQTLRGREIRTETIEYERGPVSTNGNDIRFVLSGSGFVSGRLNQEQIKEQLAGRSIEDAMTYLLSRVDLQDGSQPQIVVSPNWFDQMPILPLRITIRIQENLQ